MGFEPTTKTGFGGQDVLYIKNYSCGGMISPSFDPYTVSAVLLQPVKADIFSSSCFTCHYLHPMYIQLESRLKIKLT